MARASSFLRTKTEKCAKELDRSREDRDRSRASGSTKSAGGTKACGTAQTRTTRSSIIERDSGAVGSGRASGFLTRLAQERAGAGDGGSGSGAYGESALASRLQNVIEEIGAYRKSNYGGGAVLDAQSAGESAAGLPGFGPELPGLDELQAAVGSTTSRRYPQSLPPAGTATERGTSLATSLASRIPFKANDAVNTLNEWIDAQNRNRNYDEDRDAYYEKWGRYADESDYAIYAKIGNEIQNPTQREAEGWLTIGNRHLGGEDVGNIVTYSRDNPMIFLGEGNGGDLVGDSRYLLLKDDEVGVYNYLLAKENAGLRERGTAQEYLDDMEETLNQRAGSNMAQGVLSMGGLQKAAVLGATSLGVGLDQYRSGVRQLFHGKDELPTSPAQYYSAEASENLKGFGSQLYQAGVTVGNMLPSIVLSYITGGIAGEAGLGAEAAQKAAAIASGTAMGASAAGNAYASALSDGYSSLQAANYGTLVGASEGALQVLLGGISSLRTGTALSDRLVEKAAQIDNVLLRIAAKGTINIGSEITEEELQNYLEPAFRSIIFGEAYNAPTIEEIIETAIVTALSTGLIEGVKSAANGRADARYYSDVYGESVEDLIAEAIEIDPDNTFAQRIQEKLHAGKKVSGTAIGRLVEKNEAAIRAQDTEAIRRGDAGTERITPEAYIQLLRAAQLAPESGEAQDTGNYSTRPETPAQTQKTASTEETAVNDDPAQHTPQEQQIIEEYKDAVDENLADFYERAISGNGEKYYEMKPVSNRQAADIIKNVGVDVSGFSTRFEAVQAQHIRKMHGNGGKHDSSMRDTMDVARIQYVIDNYDYAVAGKRAKGYQENRNGKSISSKTVVFAKKVNGTYYVVEAVPDTKARCVYIYTAYMNKKGALQATDAEAPARTAKTDLANTPETSIPQTAQGNQAEYAGQTRQTGPLAAASEKYGRQAKDFTRLYMPVQNVAKYDAAFHAAWQYGKNGNVPPDVMKRLGSVSYLTDTQKEAAFEAGRTAAAAEADAQRGVAETEKNGYTGNKDNEEGADHGTAGIRIRDGGERNDSTHPGGELRELEAGTGRVQKRQADSARSADSGAASLTYGEKVSTASLGIAGGGTEANIRRVTGGDTKETAAAKQIARQRGYTLTLFAGGDLTINGEAGIRGMIDVRNKRMLVRADDPDFTARQIALHEAGHDRIAKGEIRVDNVRDRLESKYGRDYADKVAGWYAEAYDGGGMTADEIWEEAVCDSLGNMNVFSHRTDIQGEAATAFRRIKTEANADRWTARGPPAEGAIKRAANELTGGAFEMDDARYSRKAQFWHTGFSHALVTRIENWVKSDIETSTNNIGETANWALKKFDGDPIFVIYSTNDTENPTVLYAARGKQALFENEYISALMEDIKNEQRLNGKPEAINQVLNRSWMSNRGSSFNNASVIQRGANTGNAGVLRQQSGFKPSAAFRSVVENSLKVSERASGGSGTVKFSMRAPVRRA